MQVGLLSVCVKFQLSSWSRKAQKFVHLVGLVGSVRFRVNPMSNLNPNVVMLIFALVG